MHDDMGDLALVLLMTVIIAVGFVAFEFRSVYLAQPAHAAEAKVEKNKSDKANAQIAMNNRLYWIR
jgi:hypothetical protein